MDGTDSGEKVTSADADRKQAEASVYASKMAGVYQAERPFGLVLIVALIWLGVALNAFLALNAWIRAEELEEAPVLAILFIIQVVVGAALAFGLWGLREWARLGAIALYGLAFLLNFFSNFNEPLTASSLVGLVAPVAIVVYLIQPQVADKFV
jgi:hypothetical protein